MLISVNQADFLNTVELIMTIKQRCLPNCVIITEKGG
jgi:hypothetical protein